MAFDINKKIIPIGISDYKEMLDYNYYYVDKTSMLKDIIDFRCKVSLFTRPRRFGKTLNQSMLKYFFEKTEEDNSYLFRDKKIWQYGERYQQHQGKYPVISLTFKGAKMDTWEQTYIELVRAIAEEYKRHNYLLNKDIFETQESKKVFANICSEKAGFGDYAASIKNLCKYLEKYYNQKPIVLIDEYDVPLQHSYLRGFYDDAINFIRALLQDALKDNQYLEFAIMTGCLRISKESIFTGLNNLEIHSILETQYSEHFGFMQNEVDEMLKYYDLEDKRGKIKDWYNGYQFGIKNIYNPWSVLKCIKNMYVENAEPEAYWANTSGNDIVKKLIKNADNITKNEVETLIHGGTIEKPLNANITYNELDENTENIWSMLFFTGYLTYTKERREEGDEISYYELKIPNNELRYIYKVIVRAWFEEKVKEKDFSVLYKSLIEGDEEEITDELSEFLIENISFYDASESFYHGMLTGMLGKISKYRLYSNLESGRGRSDIILEPNRMKQPAIVIEIKVAKDMETAEQKCEEALEQIEKKQYETYLKKQGFNNIIKYGIAFMGKRCLAKKGE